MNGNMLRRAVVFHAVGLSGGITAAGERIGKSPPAVHADLRRFEREVGVALTERVGRSNISRPFGVNWIDSWVSASGFLLGLRARR